MRASSLVFRILAIAALVLTGLVLVPVSSQAVEVIYQGNTATGINNLEFNDVLYDITFVFQTGNSLYGSKGEGEFPFAGIEIEGESASTEEATYGASRAIQDALNAASDAITRVGPRAVNYFFIAGGEENTDPGNPDTPWVYAAFTSTYYDTITTEQRPEDTWVPADNFFIEIDIDIGGGWPPIFIDGDFFPFGMAPPLEQDIPYSWAKVEYAGGEPPTDVSVGGSVTGLVGSGLVLQNNNTDDETITSNGGFTFDTLLTPGTPYSVTVKTQPSNPAQKCTVARGWGNVPGGGVDDVLVTCGDMPEEIILITPNGGEIIPSGSEESIVWGAYAQAETFKLALSTDDGTTWTEIASDLTGTSFDWISIVPKKNEKKSLMKVVAVNANGKKIGSDTSDARFTIEVIKLTSPDGGETFTSGDPFTVTWDTNTTKKPVDKVIVEYTKNNGRDWIKLDKITGSDPGVYNGIVPDVNKDKTQSRVRVKLKDSSGNGLGKDGSDGVFTITP